METLKKSINNEYIKQYQKTKYANDEEYRRKVWENNRKEHCLMFGAVVLLSFLLPLWPNR